MTSLASVSRSGLYPLPDERADLMSYCFNMIAASCRRPILSPPRMPWRKIEHSLAQFICIGWQPKGQAEEKPGGSKFLGSYSAFLRPRLPC